MRYFCENERRKAAVRTARDAGGSPLLNGIDFLEVSPADQTVLMVYFLHPLPGEVDGFPAAPELTEDNFRIEGGARIKKIRVIPPVDSADSLVTVTVDKVGDLSTYTLRLVTSPTDNATPAGFDPQLASVDFRFTLDQGRDFDCETDDDCPPETAPEPLIDYLAKDYASFRQLILDRLSVVMPDWNERNPADLGVTLVELLAYAGDQLSYYQDAAATEAYLGTARRRVSVRRHARLLDYPMHDGCNARVWIAIEAGAGADGALLPGPTDDAAGTRFLTRVDKTRVMLPAESLSTAVSAGALVFEAMHDLVLRTAHNEIRFYTWGDERCCLPAGATSATLLNEGGVLSDLAPTDVLIFEEVRGADSGRREDTDPSHRHAIRLRRVDFSTDPLFSEADNPAQPLRVANITWDAADALPFPLCLFTVETPAEGEQPVSVAHGNVVLADHGRTLESEPLLPATVPLSGRYRPRFNRTDITRRVDYDRGQDRKRPAAESIAQDVQAAAPACRLLADDGETWMPQRDLLNSGRFAAEFVVESEDDGRAYVRFGDGVSGKRPNASATIEAVYRIGTGRAGNVGAETIGHVISPIADILNVRNPLPASGGADPEATEQVRLYAPQAFRKQERAVTEGDYAAVVQRHPEVQRAAATMRWTGSWYTMFITVDRTGGREIDADFEVDIRRFLERFRLAGHDVEIDAPQFVPLDIALTVHVKDGYFRDDVQTALESVFSDTNLRGGGVGFFHPDNFTFGQPVYLSQVVSAAMSVPGVEWVDTDDTPPKPNRFRRLWTPTGNELLEGVINMNRLEIARLDNNPNTPEFGKIEFFLQGGL